MIALNIAEKSGVKGDPLLWFDYWSRLLYGLGSSLKTLYFRSS